MTNLRLPGQYEERLLGSLGLQGLYYHRNRWYLPGVGRYLELDPMAMEGEFNGPYGPVWYAYGDGNPLRFIDPTGRETREYYKCTSACSLAAGCTAVAGAGYCALTGIAMPACAVPSQWFPWSVGDCAGATATRTRRGAAGANPSIAGCGTPEPPLPQWP